jgi:hypothetical protein
MGTEALSNCNNAALLKLFQQCVNSVTVADSTIPGAGRGLFFANEDIPAGTIVVALFYPIHSTQIPKRCVCNSVQMCEDPHERIGNENSKYALFSSLVDRPLCGVDLLKNDNNAKLFVDMNPKNTILEGWYCGYMNDAAIVCFAGDEEYYPKSRWAQNVEIVPFSVAPFQVGVTKRDVTKGEEELFVSYGYNYWINNKALFPDRDVEEEEDGHVLDSVNGTNPRTPSTTTKPESIFRHERKVLVVDMENTIKQVLEDKYREASVALRIIFDSLGSGEWAAEDDENVENATRKAEESMNSRKGRTRRISFRRLVARLLRWTRRLMR